MREKTRILLKERFIQCPLTKPTEPFNFWTAGSGLSNSFSERHSIERRSERPLIVSERERKRRSETDG